MKIVEVAVEVMMKIVIAMMMIQIQILLVIQTQNRILNLNQEHLTQMVRHHSLTQIQPPRINHSQCLQKVLLYYKRIKNQFLKKKVKVHLKKKRAHLKNQVK